MTLLHWFPSRPFPGAVAACGFVATRPHDPSITTRCSNCELLVED